MNTMIAVLLSLLLSGCAANVERSVKYSVNCSECKTPYGSGDKVSIEILKTLKMTKERK